MKTDSWQTNLESIVEDLNNQVISIRRHFHMHPEPSGQEHQTSLYLYQQLNELGLSVRMAAEGCGVIADSALPETTTPRFALRADLDALRIQDQKDVPYRSQNDGLMHACGHDAHSAMVFGAVKTLVQMEQQGLLPWPVAWRAIFQPAEETAVGAEAMIADNALQGVGAIVALHVDPTRRVGRIGMRSGVLTANCDAMRLTISGRGGHAARPHESIDPIAAAAQLISSIYLFVPRGIDSQDPVVVTIGQLIGGDNPNAIPETVELRGTLRTLDHDVRGKTINHIRQLARGLAETSGTQIDVAFEASIGSVINDPMITSIVCDAARQTLSEEAIEAIARSSMGSEDFAAYLQHVPGAMFRLGTANNSQTACGLHTPAFDIDENALAIGVKILARSAILWSNPAIS